jgi:hypothetical protein
MRDAELELEFEAELENLMALLERSDLESEVEGEAPIDPNARRRRDAIVAGDQIAHGVTDENRLTDSVFYDRHPEWSGKKLKPTDMSLRREWFETRDAVVRPMLKEAPCTGWESDPQSFSKRAVEHYLRRIWRSSFAVQHIACTAPPPNWVCNVLVDTGDGTIALSVQLSPATRTVTVSDPSGRDCVFGYHCVASGHLLLADSACPTL